MKRTWRAHPHRLRTSDGQDTASMCRRGLPTRSNEDGNILILGLGYVAIILVLLLVVLQLGSLYLYKKQLSSVADATALYLTDQRVAREYYAGTSAPSNESPKPAESEGEGDALSHSDANYRDLARESERFAARAAQSKGLPEVSLESLSTQDGESRLRVAARFKVSAPYGLAPSRGPEKFLVTLRGTSTAITIE